MSSNRPLFCVLVKGGTQENGDAFPQRPELRSQQVLCRKLQLEKPQRSAEFKDQSYI